MKPNFDPQAFSGKGNWRPSPRSGGALLFRFLFVFGLIALMVCGGVTAFGLLVNLLSNGALADNGLMWVAPVMVALPMMAMIMGRWARRRIADPLANILQAAEAISEGDLSVRVSEDHRGEFKRLLRTFNQMVEELEHTDQLRRNLTADVAHELNTPLHILQGYIEGIADGIYPADEPTLNAMLEETNLLARLVEDLRTLSLAETGALPLHLAEVNLAELLTDNQTSFSGQAEAAEVRLEVDAPSELMAWVDRDRILQILTNLTANAIRYTPAGGSIRLTAAAEAEGLTLQVIDTGRGISAEDLPYIFERFWRADKSRSHADGSGHGLGLAIARHLAKAHGGDLTAESQPDQGTTFTLTLPNKPDKETP